jgi:protein O-GlcNAc transferase
MGVHWSAQPKLLTPMLNGLRQILERRLQKLTSASAQDAPLAPVAVDVSSLRSKGNGFLASGNNEEAEHWFREALKQNPQDAPSWVCLGYALKEQGRFSEARVALKKSIAVSNQGPEEFETRYLLGQISEQENDLDDAVQQFRMALEQKPDFSLACKDLCKIYSQRGELQNIHSLLENCVSSSPACADYRIWLADTYAKEVKFDRVTEHLKIAVDLGVRSVDTYMTLGAALCRIGRVTEGAQFMALAEAMDSGVAFVKEYEVGYYHLTAGDVQKGLEHLERSVALNPDFFPAHSSIVMALSFSDDSGQSRYREAASRFAAAAKRKITSPLAPWYSEALEGLHLANTKVRVGFVAGDLREHPVMHFLMDVLKCMDRSKFCLIAYSNNPFDDAGTDALKLLFDEWHTIRHLTDEDAAKLVHGHRVDVLFDLSGHTGENRVAMFAHRPSPVQVSWLGYWASTGLQEMDFFLADPIGAPADSTQWFSEKVYRLPSTRLCMNVPRTLHEIKLALPPSLRNGFITFGSFQQASKMTNAVLRAWAKTMAAVPDSRLRIQTKAIGTPSLKDKLCQDMRDAGIDLSRVTLAHASGIESYLESHNEVDILLDTFPYPGGTTTAFALWMGVPTVTLAGNSVISRQGASMLHCVGLQDFIATSESEFVSIAVRMASQKSILTSLRAELRQKVLDSPLFDAPRFAADLQEAIIHMKTGNLIP